MNRRSFLKKGALFLPASFVFPAIVKAQSIYNSGKVYASGNVQEEQTLPTGYQANATNFANTPFWQTSAANFIDTDTTQFTFSCWANFTAASDGVAQYIFSFDTGAFSQRGVVVFKDSSNKINLNVFTSAGGGLVTWVTTTAVTSATGWCNIHIFNDLTNGANRGIYLNGSLDGNTPALYNNGTIGCNNQYCTVGSKFGGVTPLNGCLAEIYFAMGQYVSNNGKFFSGGHPVSLGSNGNLPSGSAPNLYLNNPFGTFGTDKSGTGNNLTANGSFSACGSNP